MLLGSTLLHTATQAESISLPNGVVLSPDWSWAAFFETIQDDLEGEYAQVPRLRIVRGLHAPLGTLAEKVRSLQLRWLSDPTVHRAAFAEVEQTFEARETALMRRLGWPSSDFVDKMLALTQAELAEKSRLAPELKTEAARLLAQRPGSPEALFVQTVADFLITGNTSETLRVLEAQTKHGGGDEWYFETLDSHWTDFACFLYCHGGYQSKKFNFQSDLSAEIRNLREGNVSEINDETFLESEPNRQLALLLLLAHRALVAGDEAGAQGWFSLSRLSKKPPKWFADSLKARSLVRDEESMLVWLSLCPESFHQSLDQLFKTYPADQKAVETAYQHAKTLFEKNHAGLAQNVTQKIAVIPGYEVPTADLLVQFQQPVDVSLIRFRADTPVDRRLGWIGRIALQEEDKNRLDDLEAQFAKLRGNRTIQQLSDMELRSYICLLMALKKDAEARVALKLLQSHQPELKKLDKLAETSWTQEEGGAFGRLLDAPLEPVPPILPLR